jgi:hypothetical protein
MITKFIILLTNEHFDIMTFSGHKHVDMITIILDISCTGTCRHDYYHIAYMQTILHQDIFWTQACQHDYYHIRHFLHRNMST